MITVQLFGAAAIFDDRGRDIAKLGSKARELLALLLTQPGAPLRREYVIFALWPQRVERQARSSLNTEVWKLRNALRGGQQHALAEILKTPDDGILLRPGADLFVDARTLEDVVNEALTNLQPSTRLNPEMRRRLSDALAQYRGPYLYGHDADWILIERERLNALYIRGLRLLMKDHELGAEYEDAIAFAWRLLSKDPLHERTHRDLIRLLALDERRCEAIARYRQLEEMLAAELGVAPMPETQALRDRILSGATLTRNGDPF